MRTDINGVRNISPKSRILNTYFPAISIIIPTVSIESKTIIGITQKHIINDNIGARHEIQSVTPPLIAEWFQVFDGYFLTLSAGNGIVTWIDNSNSINQYIFGICHRYALLRFEQHTISQNLHIFYAVTIKTAFQHCPTFQIDRSVGRNTEALACRIGRFMDTGLKIHHVRIILIRYILNYRIGKYVQIIQTVTVKFYR